MGPLNKLDLSPQDGKEQESSKSRRNYFVYYEIGLYPHLKIHIK